MPIHRTSCSENRSFFAISKTSWSSGRAEESILSVLCYSIGNATHAYTQFSTDGPAMNISQKCNKTLFEECTETKEYCGVDVQCAQQNDSKLIQDNVQYFITTFARCMLLIGMPR